jgi:nuclear pore complex protein Nup155
LSIFLENCFDGNTLRSQIEEFFNRLGAGEAAAMCLMLAAKLLYAEDNPGLVGMPQLMAPLLYGSFLLW